MGCSLAESDLPQRRGKIVHGKPDDPVDVVLAAEAVRGRPQPRLRWWQVTSRLGPLRRRSWWHAHLKSDSPRLCIARQS